MCSLAKKENQSDVHIPTRIGNFDRVVDPFELDSGPIKVAKWKSSRTGLTVVWADIEGPLVKGYFNVATETFNDSGFPHVLEHLVFLGSEKYPYKGILDSLANRAFADGTNATTDTTNTSFTIDTAGSDGFLRLLPVYLDHILYATLTAEGFTTEVYHINGNGEDAGVVYTEMQGRENIGQLLMIERTGTELYPPTSAYRSEVGGLMAALRLLKVEQVRKYHKTYYHPHNLQLIVTGKVDPTSLLNILQSKVEPSLIKHGQDKIPHGWKRPFLETASKGGAVLKTSKSVEMQYPGEDGGAGEIHISWVGPNSNDFLLRDALEVLGTYLSDSAVSPLSKKFIEIADPFCTAISFEATDAEKVITTAYVLSVPAERLLELSGKIKTALAEEADRIDMNRMKRVIERSALQISNQMEVDAYKAISELVVSNFVFGGDEQLRRGLSEQLKRFRILASWTLEQWSLTLKAWLVKNPSVTVIGKPSAELARKLSADANARLQATREKYGPEGLKKLQEKLDAAQRVNDTPFPKKVLSDFPIADINSIKFIEVQTARANGNLTKSSGPSSPLQTEIDQSDPTILPFFVQFDHVESNFITLAVHLSPISLPPDLFKYFYIYFSAFFSLPVKLSDGTSLTFEQVVRKLDEETVSYDAQMGVAIGQTLQISLKFATSKYATMIGFLKDLLWGSKFDPERLRIATAQALQDIPQSKQDPEEVSSALYRELLFSPDLAPSLSMNIFKQDSWFPQLMEELQNQPQEVVKQMERLRSALLHPSTMRFSVIGNIRGLTDPKKSWLAPFSKFSTSSMKAPLYNNAVLSQEGTKPSGTAVVVSMSSSESSYAYHVARGPQGFAHPDRPALMVAISALNATEGFIWKAIRGTGLAYATAIRSTAESGHVYFGINRSPDSWRVFQETNRVMKDLISKKLELDELTLESAKSTLTYTVAASESTRATAAYASFVNSALKGVAKDDSRQLLKAIKDITIDQVLNAIATHLLPIFDPRSSAAVVAGSVDQAKAISAKLQSAGFKVQQRQLTDSA